jgi:hypothetical protein
MPHVLRLRPFLRFPLRGVGVALLWGLVELIALARSRWVQRRQLG